MGGGGQLGPVWPPRLCLLLLVSKKQSLNSQRDHYGSSERESQKKRGRQGGQKGEQEEEVGRGWERGGDGSDELSVA